MEAGHSWWGNLAYVVVPFKKACAHACMAPDCAPTPPGNMATKSASFAASIVAGFGDKSWNAAES
eukprot:8981080-Alexandrium_andersonii.AAC.1